MNDKPVQRAPRAFSFRRSGPGCLIAAATLVVAAVTAVALLLTARLLRTAHDGDYVLMQQVLHEFLESMEETAAMRAELVSDMPDVHAALGARDRPKLLAVCKQMYEAQEKKYDVDQAQFHVPPGVSFLRLHNPDKFGDDQTSYRPMLVNVHQTKTLRRGLAITKSGPVVSAIVPVTDGQGNFLGSFEVGVDLAPEFDEIKEHYGLEAAVFFDEKVLRELAPDIDPELMSSNNRVGKFMRIHATHPELSAALVTDRDLEITEPKNYQRDVAGTAWGVQLVPLYNYAKKQVGVAALAANFGEDETLAGRARIWQLLAAFVAIIASVGAILVVIRGTLLRPLAALNDRLAALAGGDDSQPAPPMDHHCQELRDLADSYERLRSGKGS